MVLFLLELNLLFFAASIIISIRFSKFFLIFSPLWSKILIPLNSGGLWLAEIMIPLLNFSFLIKNGIAGVGQIPKYTNSFPASLIPLDIASKRISPLILVSLPINIGLFVSTITPKAYPTLYAREYVISFANRPLIPSVPNIDLI